ncbi:ribosome biogenesis GTP-binding protein YihA/YsxC [Desulfotomaculum copahuensis]|uniref:Probable GTP-binding protein EngB n=1 Tax=Desulfotomaculum copahuensis TaxID=1838280 RepID=A0A1B7LF07_9FIRM|nr:ribosome biogenesis GTP-binding protein YihA/YsxC [Desulfotomaculum copahuensis]OAT82220.1 YihA family ribosome biogenesis GTP-binding protein [Desulfotomaculum copahuensis]
MNTVSAEFVISVASLSQCPAGGLPEVALAGRSNVGKSSLLNRLVNRRGLARTSNTPGRTQMLNYFLINQSFYLVDLPGYGYAKVPEKMRAGWGRLIQSYLEKRRELRGVIQIVDLRHPPTAQDVQLHEWLKYHRLPTAVVATKADKLSRSQGQKNLQVVRRVLCLDENEPLVMFSAQTGQGKEEVWQVIEQWST